MPIENSLNCYFIVERAEKLKKEYPKQAQILENFIICSIKKQAILQAQLNGVKIKKLYPELIQEQESQLNQVKDALALEIEKSMSKNPTKEKSNIYSFTFSNSYNAALYQQSLNLESNISKLKTGLRDQLVNHNQMFKYLITRNHIRTLRKNILFKKFKRLNKRRESPFLQLKAIDTIPTIKISDADIPNNTVSIHISDPEIKVQVTADRKQEILEDVTNFLVDLDNTQDRCIAQVLTQNNTRTLLKNKLDSVKNKLKKVLKSEGELSKLKSINIPSTDKYTANQLIKNDTPSLQLLEKRKKLYIKQIFKGITRDHLDTLKQNQAAKKEQRDQYEILKAYSLLREKKISPMETMALFFTKKLTNLNKPQTALTN